MSKMLRSAIEEQRNYYIQKLKAIGVYNNQLMSNMTITELSNEYKFYYQHIPHTKIHDPANDKGMGGSAL